MDATYVSGTSFTVVGDQTAIFTAGRAVKCDCAGDGIKYGWVASSAFDAVTTVTLESDSDAITGNLATASWSSVDAASMSRNTKIINLTGGQIKFPASAVASGDPNTIDEYEEGYYTATLTCGTSGTITVNTSWDQLAYTKIGRLVYTQGRTGASAISSPLGSLQLNLPFTASSLTERSDACAGSVIIESGTGDVESLAGYVKYDGVSVYRILEQVGTGTGIVDDLANHIDAGTAITVGFSYLVE